jgi:signal transduction histidine kinase
MKILLLFLIIVSSFKIAYAQQARRDSLLVVLSKAKRDTTKVNLLFQLGESYGFNNPDSLFFYMNESMKLAQHINYLKGEIVCKRTLAHHWWLTGDYATAVKLNLQLLDYAKSQKDHFWETMAYTGLLNSYRDQGDYREALRYKDVLLKMVEELPVGLGVTNAMIGSVYYGMNELDSAHFYLQKALSYPHTISVGWIYLINGRIEAKRKNIQAAFINYQESVKFLQEENNLKDLAGAYISIGELHQDNGQSDSAVYYGNQARAIAQQKQYNKELLEAYLLLSKANEKINSQEALSYFKKAMVAKDSLFNQDKQRQILSYKFNEELRQNEIKAAAQEAKTRNSLYLLLSVLICSLLVAAFLIRNNKHKQKLNTLLQHQKEELQSTLEHLQATQTQLIQSEKMASLGELTAGIAHEIQNPLNFVNNFSEVSTELVDELEQEAKAGNTEEVLAITADLKQNLSKIHHHGRRADSIVKGMLQHSRLSSGEKQLTDINALADEYLRLSYHGLRAKEKDFNAEFKLELDPAVGKVEVAPQEIGRVLLNLFNNAFYATQQKGKLAIAGEDTPYQPQVIVSTKKLGSKIEIKVKDNGTGIPENIKSKIFQPFFTTKPTGEGTGLGLSLSYDIITKGHGGELKVESKEGEYTTIILHLPLQA